MISTSVPINRGVAVQDKPSILRYCHKPHTWQETASAVVDDRMRHPEIQYPFRSIEYVDHNPLSCGSSRPSASTRFLKIKPKFEKIKSHLHLLSNIFSLFSSFIKTLHFIKNLKILIKEPRNLLHLIIATKEITATLNTSQKFTT